jgi:hypothetical protein
MPFSGKLPSREAVEKALVILGVRVKSDPETYADIVFETAARIEEMEKLDRPAAEGRGNAGNSSRSTRTS